MTDLDDTYTNYARDRYIRQARGVAARLLRIANEVTRNTDRLESNSKAFCTQAASDVVHEVMWGIANANLDTLISSAGDADESRNLAQKEEKE